MPLRLRPSAAERDRTCAHRSRETDLSALTFCGARTRHWPTGKRKRSRRPRAYDRAEGPELRSLTLSPIRAPDLSTSTAASRADQASGAIAIRSNAGSPANWSKLHDTTLLDEMTTLLSNR